MGADNWRVCPRCLKKARFDHAAAQNTARDAYGKVPLEKFLQLKQEADKPFQEPKESFREDYEIGVDTDGEFSVTYSGRCQECDLSFSFKTTEQVKV